jgi:hypothetical protein
MELIDRQKDVFDMKPKFEGFDGVIYGPLGRDDDWLAFDSGQLYVLDSTSRKASNVDCLQPQYAVISSPG